MAPPLCGNSLSEASPELSITKSPTKSSSSKTSPVETSAARKKSLRLSACASFKKGFGWPSWMVNTKPASFTITLSEFLKDEASKINIAPPDAIQAARDASLAQGFSAASDLWDMVEGSLISLIYGSNRIENAGNGYDITVNLCQKVFQGVDVTASITEQAPDYAEHIKHLVHAKRQTNQAEVVRSRREIIQHAIAIIYIVDKIVWNGESWSEDVILETHRILYDGLHDDVAAGEYRVDEVAATYVDPEDPKGKERKNIFIRAGSVKAYMGEFVKSLDGAIARAEASLVIDPYELAAKYHHQFVNIHPFSDGNGRMSRIILNVLLLKYAGHVTSFGGEGAEKEIYLGVAHRAGRKFHEEDGEVKLEDQTGHHELGAYTLSMSKRHLERLWTWAKGKKN